MQKVLIAVLMKNQTIQEWINEKKINNKINEFINSASRTLKAVSG